MIMILALAASWCSLLSAQGQSSDDQIHDDVLRRLANDTTVKGGAIEIEVTQGVVTLIGKVKTDKQKSRAESLTKKVKGVTKVVNKLVVDK
jgi:osmotically-inducible protein OsmY